MAIKLSNRGFSDVRLRIVPDAGTTLAIDHTTNPCVTMSADNKELFACLGPFEISCVGAVSDSGPIDLNGRFNIRLDGQLAASNMTAEELVEHFKDHPDIEVGLYEEEMIGAPYSGSYMADSMAPYLSDSSEVIDSGTTINLTVGEGAHVNDVLDGWVAIQMIDSQQNRHSLVTRKLRDMPNLQEYLQTWGSVVVGGTNVRINYSTAGFVVEFENMIGPEQTPFAVAIFTPLSQASTPFGTSTTVTNLADFDNDEFTNVIVGSIRVVNGV